MTTENAKRLLEGLVEKLDTQTIAAFCRKRLFSEGVELPMMKWSTLNKFFCFISGTSDARGVDQWRKVGRWPRKGSHAIYIIVPMLRTKTNVENFKASTELDPEEKTQQVLSGFKCMPVFRVEDTEGAELPYQETIRAFDPSKFPLYQLAVAKGIKVSAALTRNAYGFFSPDEKAITLGTDDVTTWMHELSHAIDAEIPGHSEEYAFNEVVAELSSCFLCSLYNLPHHEEHTKAYIEAWQGLSSVAFEIMKASDRVMAIYSAIASFQAQSGTQEVSQA